MFSNRKQTKYDDDALEQEAYKRISIIQEFYIEFFGTFIPGFVFIFLFLFLFFYSFYYIAGVALFDEKVIEGVSSWSFWIVMTIFSYVMGAVLYRKPPKDPDRLASYRQWCLTPPGEERNKLAVQYPEGSNKHNFCKKKMHDLLKNKAVQYPEGSNKHNFFIKKIYALLKNKMELFRYIIVTFYHKIKFNFNRKRYITKLNFNPDYPYPHIRQYLLWRGMSHLIFFVPWCAKNGLNERSKITINIIKHRIRKSNNLNLILDMLRNEGHIRLLTSLWYAMFYLRALIFFAFAAISFWWIYRYKQGKTVTFIEFSEHARGLYLFLIPGMFLALTWVKRSIESSIHYVRNREIVMILEAAYLIDNKSGDSSFKEFVRRDNKFRSEQCKNCDSPTCKRNK